MDKQYNAVQWSRMSGDKSEQWVLRGETVEEVMLLKDELEKKAFPEPTPVRTVPIEQMAGSVDICPTHNVPYDKSGISKKNGKPWSAHKLSNGDMCWKSNR